MLYLFPCLFVYFLFFIFIFLNMACFTYLFMGVIFLKYKFRIFFEEVELYLIMRKKITNIPLCLL